jgi:hypothetical protein
MYATESQEQATTTRDLFSLGNYRPLLSFKVFENLQALNDLSLNYCHTKRPKECKLNKFIL